MRIEDTFLARRIVIRDSMGTTARLRRVGSGRAWVRVLGTDFAYAVLVIAAGKGCDGWASNVDDRNIGSFGTHWGAPEVCNKSFAVAICDHKKSWGCIPIVVYAPYTCRNASQISPTVA